MLWDVTHLGLGLARDGHACPLTHAILSTLDVVVECHKALSPEIGLASLAAFVVCVTAGVVQLELAVDVAALVRQLAPHSGGE